MSINEIDFQHTAEIPPEHSLKRQCIDFFDCFIFFYFLKEKKKILNENAQIQSAHYNEIVIINKQALYFIYVSINTIFNSYNLYDFSSFSSSLSFF